MAFPVQCGGCGARFALGLLHCPRCQSVSPQYAKPLKEQVVPRITVANGPTNPGALPGEVGYIPPPAAPAEGARAPEPAESTTPDIAAPPAATDGAPVPGYAALTVPQLRDAAKARGLSTSGTKADLLERLTAPAAEGGD